MPPGLSPVHILVVFVVALIVLGPQRLPEVARQVGKAFAEFRRWSDGLQAEIRDALDVEGTTAPTATAPTATPPGEVSPTPEPPHDQP
jgi:Tat protein translocase TatB subunit